MHFYSVQVQTKGFYFTGALVCSLQKCNLKLSIFLAKLLMACILWLAVQIVPCFLFKIINFQEWIKTLLLNLLSTKLTKFWDLKKKLLLSLHVILSYHVARPGRLQDVPSQNWKWKCLQCACSEICWFKQRKILEHFYHFYNTSRFSLVKEATI